MKKPVSPSNVAPSEEKQTCEELPPVAKNSGRKNAARQPSLQTTRMRKEAEQQTADENPQTKPGDRVTDASLAATGEGGNP